MPSPLIGLATLPNGGGVGFRGWKASTVGAENGGTALLLVVFVGSTAGLAGAGGNRPAGLSTLLGGVGASFDGTAGWGVKEGKLGALDVWDSDVGGQPNGLLLAGPAAVDGVVDEVNEFNAAIVVGPVVTPDDALEVVAIPLLNGDGAVEVVADANGLTAGFAGSAVGAGVGAKGFC